MATREAAPAQDEEAILELEIPEGFALARVGPQKTPILVPTYMMPTPQQLFDIKLGKKTARLDKGSPLVCIFVTPIYMVSVQY